MVRSRKKKAFTSLNTKSARVILYSNYANEHPHDKIISHLKQHNTLTKDDMKKLNISADALGDLIRLCQSEWVLVPEMSRNKDENDPKRVKCDLCDQPDLESLFFVRNKITERIMCIGSTCVLEYGVKKADAEHSYNKYLVENYITENLPGLNMFLEQNKRLVSKYSLISLNMLRKWENQIEKLATAKEKCIKRPNTHLYVNLKKEWEATKQLETEIELYLKRISSDKLFPTKEIIKWINQSEEKAVLQKLIRTNDGLIGKNSFSRIWEDNYVKMLLKEVQQKNDWIKIMEPASNARAIKFKLTELRAFDATLMLAVKDFLEVFTEFIFGESYNERAIEDELIAESVFDRDPSLYVKIFRYFVHRVEKLGFTEIVTEKSTEIVLYKKGYYYVINGETFANKLKMYYLHQDERNPELMNILESVIQASVHSKYTDEQWNEKVYIEKNQEHLIKNKIEQ